MTIRVFLLMIKTGKSWTGGASRLHLPLSAIGLVTAARGHR